MTIQIEREWAVVQGNKILFGPVDSKQDAKEYANENTGDLVAFPKHGTPGLL